MRKLTCIAVAIGAAALLTAPAVSAPKTVTLTAKLKGANEVPGPGDADGSGKAVIRLNRAKSKVCFNITVNRIDGATAAHIHGGPKGVAGDVVVPLFLTATDEKEIKGCVQDVDAEDMAAIRSEPKGFYVNVHNVDHPAGAIRGQLRKKKPKS